jgi:integrase/recombinase XerD
LQFRATGKNQRGALALSLLILDTGLRLSEALNLRLEDINFDSCILKVFGKGRKERLVPFSPMGRKFLWQYCRKASVNTVQQLVLGCRSGLPMSKSNAERDVRELGKRAGLSMSLHSHLLRHRFATFYIRNGGDAPRLQRILGHTTIGMTMKYVHLQTADLAETHQRLSPVGRASR